MDPLEGLRIVNPAPGKKFSGMTFSKTELIHITIAVLVLAVAFTMMLRKGSHLDPNPLMNILYLFGVSLMLVVCSFLLHEIGHKFMAQSYGAWSEFRMYPAGLFMALVFSLFGFLFAAPGAVYIQGNITKEQNGKISLAGPLVNFIIAVIGIALCLTTTGLASQIFFMLGWLNAFLGVFNMIPFPPLDGHKIALWSIPVYIVFAAIGIAELLVMYYFIVV